jgi:predicted Zn-dependent peptidase
LRFERHTLPNGLEIVAECNDAAYSTALGFFVRTGARDETDAEAGVSHFLEHMMFKGTPTRSADDVNREFDEIGAYYNACTDEENTIYYANVLPEYQDRAVDLLADILRPSLRTADFETEKQVILEEIHMYDDQPPFGADERCRAAYFGSHPLGRSVLGTAQSVTSLSVEAMRDYFERRYTPANIVLVGAGRVRFDELVRTAEARCGQWESQPVSRVLGPAEPKAAFLSIHKKIATQQYALQLSPAPFDAVGERYAAKLLATVLGDDSGSRLYWELVDPGLAEHAELQHAEYADAGVMITFLCCAPEEAADNLVRIACLYRSAEQEGVTEVELRQAKNKVSSRVVLSSERPRGRLFAVGADWLCRGEYRSVEDDLQALGDVTLDDLHDLLAHYPLSTPVTVTIGPLESVCSPASSAD